MAILKPLTRRYNKKLRKNLEGLLSKYYKYRELNRVKLAIYINYTERGEFISYKLGGFSYYRQIIEKVS